jgi:hypothetical protein
MLRGLEWTTSLTGCCWCEGREVTLGVEAVATQQAHPYALSHVAAHYEQTASAQDYVRLTYGCIIFTRTTTTATSHHRHPSSSSTSVARLALVARKAIWGSSRHRNLKADFNLSGQRSQDPPNLLQGQGLQEAHPAQGHPLVILAHAFAHPYTETV